MESLTPSSSTVLWNSPDNDSIFIHELLKHLKYIKNIFLLGHREFIPSFITNTSNILDRRPTEHTTKEINIIFQNIIKNIMPNDKSCLDYIYFDVPSSDQNMLRNTGWDEITVQYRVPEPFRFFFNHEIFNIYNSMFLYLLKVQKVKGSSLNAITTGLSSGETHREIEMLTINLHVIFAMLIGYLDNVFDSQFTLMESAIMAAKNLEDVRTSHSTFLSNIISRSFLTTNYDANSNGPERYFVQELLIFYNDYIEYRSMSGLENDLDANIEDVKLMYDRFNSIKNLAITTMKSVSHDEFTSKYLRILILSFDFNVWGKPTNEITNLDEFLKSLHI